MRLGPMILTVLAFALALLLSAFAARSVAALIENRTRIDTMLALELADHHWADVETDGLQVLVSGTAPTEAQRFRAIATLGDVVESSRIVDLTEVARPVAFAPPEFSIELLRNDDGISLIGLAPKSTDRDALVTTLVELAPNKPIADMLESIDYPAPPGWQPALDFAVSAIKILPRAKISVGSGSVSITAITESRTEKAHVETDLARRTPAGLVLKLDISAPRPVITPFLLRFLIDEEGARFDACSADTERARDMILEAARAAGAQGVLGCTLGMGVPTTHWASAVTLGIAALRDLGGGSVTFADADVALIADERVDPALFDRVVGELESNLPDVFSLSASQPQKPANGVEFKPEFFALLNPEGGVQLRGRIGDERQREAIQNFARARFGTSAVYVATRLEENLPTGWPVRVLAGIEALAELDNGSVLVQPDMIRISGVTGDALTSDRVAGLITARLGETASFDLAIIYEPPPEPEDTSLSDTECVGKLNAVLSANKITFEPGSSVIAAQAAMTMNALAEILSDCADAPIQVGGHTDSQGSDELNQRLSYERARAVILALQQRRVLTSNLIAVGFGETQPIGDNATEAGREANRRIEFVLLEREAEPAPDPAQDEGSSLNQLEPPKPAPEVIDLDDAPPPFEVLVETEQDASVGAPDVAQVAQDEVEAEPEVAIEVKAPTSSTPRPKKRPAGLTP
jgi:OOP family OmpA-OmpF porin